MESWKKKGNQVPETLQFFHRLTPRELQLQILPNMQSLKCLLSQDLIDVFIEKSNEMIEKIVDDSKDQADLLDNIRDLAINSLFFKSGIMLIYKNIMTYIEKKNYQKLKKMSFSDFIFFISTIVKQKGTLGVLLSWEQVPIQIYLDVAGTPVLMNQLLKDIMGIKKFSLIFNCGLKAVKKQDRTKFLFDFFSLPSNYLYKESDLYQDEIYVHTISPENGNNLLVDFNGSFDNIPLSLQEKSALIIIHILYSELILEDKFIGEEYFKNCEKLLSDAEKVIILIRGLQYQNIEKVQAALGIFRDKCLVFSIPLVIQNAETTYDQISQEIQKKKFLVLQKTFSYYEIFNLPNQTAITEIIQKQEIQEVHQEQLPQFNQSMKNIFEASENSAEKKIIQTSVQVQNNNKNQQIEIKSHDATTIEIKQKVLKQQNEGKKFEVAPISLERDLDNKKQQSDQIQNRMMNVNLGSQAKDNIDKSSQKWIEKIVYFYQSKFWKECQKKLKQHIDKSCENYNEEKIRTQALRRSFQNKFNDKAKWIECFKMMTNPNKYFFEIICEATFIKNRKSQCSRVMKEFRPEITKLFQSQFIEPLKQFKNEKNGSKGKEIIQKFVKYELVSLGFKNYDDLIRLSNYLDQQNVINDNVELIQTYVTIHKLNNMFEEYLNSAVKVKLIGCPATCPFCGVKCQNPERDEKKHVHSVKHENHVMSCFKGSTWVRVGTPSYLICGSKDQLRNGCVKYNSLDPLNYLETYHKQWSQYFKSIPQGYIPKNEENLHQIWINVKDMLRRHSYRNNRSVIERYKNMKDDQQHSEKFEKKYKNQPLEDSDVKKIRYFDLQGRGFSLLSY